MKAITGMMKKQREGGMGYQRLPVRTQGERLTVEHSSVKDGKTKPPARFTEATLLAAMENPVKYLSTKDSQAAKTLGETGGLGTVAHKSGHYSKSCLRAL